MDKQITIFDIIKETELTLNQIILNSGIEIIRTDNKKIVYLKYNNKSILRPNAERCYDIVLREFGINLKNYE